MQQPSTTGAAILGAFILAGLAALGFLLGKALIEFRQLERSVAVKGLSEREFPADTVIWPIQFTAADNDLQALYRTIEQNTARVRSFLLEKGFSAEEITAAAPAVTDLSAQQYGGNSDNEFRYTAMQTVTVYTTKVDQARQVMGALSELGRDGIVISGNNFQSQTEYVFSRLNDVKPEMIEESTRNAREVALKFAADSQSALGKIKLASQGQFSISDRDQNTPHIKKVRVVSTVEYYLSD